MPYLPGVPCSNRGCSAIVPGGGRCPACKVQYNREYDTTMRNQRASKFYRSRTWKRLRTRQLAIEPLCRGCKENGGAVVPATQVDHIIPWAGNYNLATDMNNLQSLCRWCHDVKSSKEKAARGRGQ